jgi:hypothetical protein
VHPAAASAAIQLSEDVRDGAETRLSGLILSVEGQVQLQPGLGGRSVAGSAVEALPGSVLDVDHT